MAAVAFACESQSTRSVGWSAAARQAAKLTAVVVLPTPPFWLATAMMRAKVRLRSEKLAKVLDRCKMFHVERRNRMWIFFQSASIVLRGSERVVGKSEMVVPLGCSTWNIAIGRGCLSNRARAVEGGKCVGGDSQHWLPHTGVFHVEQLLVEL